VELIVTTLHSYRQVNSITPTDYIYINIYSIQKVYIYISNICYIQILLFKKIYIYSIYLYIFKIQYIIYIIYLFKYSIFYIYIYIYIYIYTVYIYLFLNLYIDLTPTGEAWFPLEPQQDCKINSNVHINKQ